MKNQRYKLHEATAGKKVVVTDKPTATIYHIVRVNNYTVQLGYYSCGQECGGGFVDIGHCYHPSDEQLNHALFHTEHIPVTGHAEAERHA